MKRPLVSVAFLLFVACGNLNGVGSPCTVNGDCDVGLNCNTTAPGGLCTHGCSFEGASLSECPAGSICSNIGNNTQVCVTTCTAANECREKYECNGTTGSTVKACRPIKN